MYISENIEIKTHKLTASIIGFGPVFFRSLIEIVVPTTNRVKTNSLLENSTIVLVAIVGNNW